MTALAARHIVLEVEVALPPLVDCVAQPAGSVLRACFRESRALGRAGAGMRLQV